VALAAEEYDSFGPRTAFSRFQAISRSLATTDYSGSKFFGINVESGMGTV